MYKVVLPVMFFDVCSWVPLSLTVKLHLLCIWTLSSSDSVKLWISKSYRGQLKDSNTNNIKGSNIHWCSRRKHDALRTKDVHIHTMCMHIYKYTQFFFIQTSMHRVSSWSISECLNLFVFKCFNCPRCENMHLKIIQSKLKILRDFLGNFCRTLRVFFLKDIGQFNCSLQTRDSWTTITKQKKQQQKKQLRIIQVMRDRIKNQGHVSFWKGLFL